ncbi:MAG TPA: formate dehydrogenase subunit gamma [Gallionella sp.]|nr:formate dehydrogenase subunit gamma [Gallionella sp.]
MSDQSEPIVRYTAPERANHWMVAILFILAALGGLSLFHPYFFWLSNLFGSGTWTRILHPFIGTLMFLSFLGLTGRFWAHNRITAADRQWMSQMGDVLNKRRDRLPEVGRYNAGQKYLFWVMVATMILLLISGILFWQPWFAPYFPIGLIRVAVVVHALSAFVLIMGIIVHIYAAIWTKGSISAMTRGTVTAAWAKHHHPGWYREVSKEVKQ